MLIRLFRSDVSYQILIILLLSGLLWVPAFLHPLPPAPSGSGILLYQWIYQHLLNVPLLSVIFAFVLLITEAVFLNLLLSSHDLMPRNSALAAILYIILMSWSPELLTITPALLSNAMLLILLYLLLGVFEKKEAYQEIFSAALVIGLTTFLDVGMGFLLILIFLSMLVYRIFSWREWFITILGFIIPFYFTAVYFFWNDAFTMFLTETTKFIRPGFGIHYLPSWKLTTFLITFGIIILWTVFSVLSIIQEKVIAIRKKYTMILWFFFICLAAVPLSSPSLPVRTGFLLIPAASLLTYYLGFLKKLWLMELAFGFLCLMIVLIRL